MDQRSASAFRSRALTVLALSALLALTVWLAPAQAAAPAAAGVAAQPAAAFLASLATDVATQPAQLPIAAGTSCTDDSQCPTGTLCCRACGFFGCTAKACLAPMNGHCPLIP